MCGILVVQGDTWRPEHQSAFETIAHRGPDDHEVVRGEHVIFAFHRLAIMDPSHAGDQPFHGQQQGAILVCNGEIFNHRDLRAEWEDDYSFHSRSDCEVLVPMLASLSLQEVCERLDAEFAFVYFDPSKGKVVAARDAIGIRPLFYGIDPETGGMCFASEMKALHGFCEHVEPFPPGHYWDGERFHCFEAIAQSEVRTEAETEAEVLQGIHDLLVQGVEKRLQADVPVGFLLSGGLDSSLVCAIAARASKQPIRTFSVGCNVDAIDIAYAEEVARHIDSHHTNVIFTHREALDSLRKVIYHLETWDITTIRASVGMYLVCQYIHRETDIKVLLTGEVSDELFGYKYTDFAPDPEAFQSEAIKRIEELYMYDVLRADRCISAHSLEARVPFADRAFVRYVMGIAPQRKMNSYGIGKYLLRKAFESGEYLPERILMREKAAFSDAVGHSVVDEIKAYADREVSDEDLAAAKERFPYATPFTKESFLYRSIFEEYFSGRASAIRDFWMPNKTWQNCDVADPSARVLPNYGKSGQ